MPDRPLRKAPPRRTTPKPGELRSYVHSGGFSRLAGQSTAPGSMVRPKEALIRKVLVTAAEVAFLTIGLWYMFRGL